MFRLQRSLGHFVSTLFGVALFLSGCATPSSVDIQFPKSPASPNGQISDITFYPSARCVLRNGEPLYVRYDYDVSNSSFQIFTKLSAPTNYAEFYDHGFLPGSSPCPPLTKSHGFMEQRLSVAYRPKRDQHSLSDKTYPPFYRATQIEFSIRDLKTKNYRVIHTAPIDVSWICEKQSHAERQHALDLSGWEQVKKLYPDTRLPEPKRRKNRSKKKKVPEYLMPVKP